MNGFRVTIATFYLFLAFSSQSVVTAQTNQDRLEFESRVFAPLTSGKLPFWLWTNQRGKVNEEGISSVQDLSYRPKLTNFGNFEVETGADLTLSNGVDYSLNISQLFADVRYKKIGAKFGRFYQIQGLNDGELAVGSMMKSRNPGALIGASAGTTQFNSFPLAQGYFRYHVGISHFWFDDERYVDNALLHSKFLYLQIDLSPLKLVGGIVHNVMWGGTSPDIGKMPTSFNDYLRVVFARGAGQNTTINPERTNALGNTIGAYDYGILWDSKNIDLKISRLFYVEDVPGATYRSAWDGQWSFDLFLKNRPFLTRLRYDYVYTIRQDSKISQPDGRADYYHHYIYKSGWTNQGYVMGVPLITFDEKVNSITNNVLVAQSIAAEISPSHTINVRIFGMYSRNYGICDDILIDPSNKCSSTPKTLHKDAYPRNTNQRNMYSSKIEMNFRYNSQVLATFSLAYDAIEGRSNRLGLNLGIRYKIWPSSKSE